jgi:hypothetical protein
LKLADLHGRTKIEAFLVVSRPSTDDYIMPHIYATSARTTDFCNMVLGMDSADLPKKFEAFIISGVKGENLILIAFFIDISTCHVHAGSADHFTETLGVLKKQATALVTDKASEALGRRLSRMYYTGFDEHITVKYGLTVKNWPFPEFRSPNDLTIMNDVRILINSLQSGTTHFTKLTDNELEVFRIDFYKTVATAHCSSGSPSTGAGSKCTSQSSNTAAAGMDGPLSRPPLTNITQVASSTLATVTASADGQNVQMTTKKRKTRSDKGKSRGPRKKASPTVTVNASEST